MTSVKTPCVGICSTVFGDEVCRGCKRFVHEVIDWNSYDSDQKLLVKERLRILGSQVLSSKIVVQDKALFFDSLEKASVDLKLNQTEQVLEFLRKASSQIDSLEDHGLKALPEYRQHTAKELKELIDAEIHILSTATYRRNFKRGHFQKTENGKITLGDNSSIFRSEKNEENEAQLQ